MGKINFLMVLKQILSARSGDRFEWSIWVRWTGTAETRVSEINGACGDSWEKYESIYLLFSPPSSNPHSISLAHFLGLQESQFLHILFPLLPFPRLLLSASSCSLPSSWTSSGKQFLSHTMHIACAGKVQICHVLDSAFPVDVRMPQLTQEEVL